MMVQIQKLTAETLLSAPRLSPVVPNHDGTLGLYTVSTHTFGDKTAKEVQVLDIGTGLSRQLSDDDKVNDVCWIPGSTNEVLYLKSEEKGKTKVVVADAGDLSKEHCQVTEVDAPIANVKLKQLSDGMMAFVFTGLIGDNGELFNDEAVKKKSTARVFDTTNVRVWNELYKPQLYGIWYTTLVKEDKTWKLSRPFHNILQHTKLEVAGIYDVAEATDNFAICSKGIAFLARDAADRTVRTRADTYPFFSPLSSFHDPPPQKPQMIGLPEGIGSGESTSLRIAPDEATLGFLHAPGENIYNRRLYLTGVEDFRAFDAFASVPEAQDEKTYEPPVGFDFAGSSTEVILQRQNHGREVLLYLDLDSNSNPRPVTAEGTVQAFYPLKAGNWDTLLVTSSSFIDSSLVQIIHVPNSRIVRTVFSATKNGAKFGLSRTMYSDVYYQGENDIDVHTFIVRPKDFDERKTYPWVLMPHGGPVSAWTDSWSTRWNIASWAEQGYIIICPNISGSTGFGLSFAKRINGQWGGNPYEDLLKLIDYLATFAYLDQSKAVLAGASYGAYMTGWLMGHEIINKFCCAIWHDGIFNIPTFMLQTEFPTDDASFGGRAPFLWNNSIALDWYNPARPGLLRNYENAAPPTLVIHSEKDYRCPITEGLALFQTLQAQGVPSRFLTFEDECHWVTGPENALVWHHTVWDWVRRCVDGEIKRGDRQW